MPGRQILQSHTKALGSEELCLIQKTWPPGSVLSEFIHSCLHFTGILVNKHLGRPCDLSLECSQCPKKIDRQLLDEAINRSIEEDLARCGGWREDLGEMGHISWDLKGKKSLGWSTERSVFWDRGVHVLPWLIHVSPQGLPCSLPSKIVPPFTLCSLPCLSLSKMALSLTLHSLPCLSLR